jgi:LPS sulfotransferase NodH
MDLGPPGATDPVFVVGMPRSGTTLLAAMLSAHSRMTCGPETQFFTHLAHRRGAVPHAPSPWPQVAVGYVESLTINGQSVVDAFGLSIREIERHLQGRQPSWAAALESIVATFARGLGKPRWVEKTPNHLLHLSTIRREFPTARIVRILRDPRDAALSMRQLPWTSDDVLPNLHLWEEWDRVSWRFFESDGLSMTVRYESLAAEPRGELSRICDFLGERFEDAMLDTSATGSAVAARGEFWKETVRRPVSTQRIGVWRRELDPSLQRLAGLVCSDGLRRYGYPADGGPLRTVYALPWSRRQVEDHTQILVELAERGVRVLAADPCSTSPDDRCIADTDGLALTGCPVAGKGVLESFRRHLRLWLALARRGLGRTRVPFLLLGKPDETPCGTILRMLCRAVSADSL